ncbi:MAG: hypothetical protein K6A69_06735 [Lachnospiraceae bacterium]|nr:hypothetical protein [Lachnospiraceae bacterium]
MSAIITAIIQYAVTAVILALVGFAGVKVGIALRKNKNAKEEGQQN